MIDLIKPKELIHEELRLLDKFQSYSKFWFTEDHNYNENGRSLHLPGLN